MKWTFVLVFLLSITFSLFSSSNSEKFEQVKDLRKQGKKQEAMTLIKEILVSDPNHQKALSFLGFRTTPQGLVPDTQRLLNNGWMLKNKRWQPNPGFNYEAFEESSQQIKKLFNRLTRITKKSGGYQLAYEDIQKKVKETGSTAVPILTKLSKSIDKKKKYTAYKMLSQFEPEHLREDLIKKYPKEKNNVMAEGMASVLIKLSPHRVPNKMAVLLEKGSDDEAMRVAQLAAMTKDKSLARRVLVRWVLIEEQLETRNGGTRVVGAVLDQKAYVRDLNAVIAPGGRLFRSTLFDPEISYTQSGGVIDVRVVKVEVFRRVMRELTEIRGQRPGDFQELLSKP